MIYLVLQYLRGILQEFDFSVEKWQYQLYYLLFIICCCGCGERGMEGAATQACGSLMGAQAWNNWCGYVIGLNTILA